jgi:uncharacterized lipoprotein YmbA
MNHALRAIAIVLATTIAACASAPVGLVTLPPAPAAEANLQAGAITIRLRDVKLPGYLETFPVVIGRTDNSLVVAHNIEWAERLPDSVSRVLRDALSQRLGTSRVLVAGERRLPDADLAVEFLALDPREGVLALDARWFVSCGASGATSRGGRIRLQVPLEQPTARSVAAATTQALARFADLLAAEIACAPSSDQMATVR